MPGDVRTHGERAGSAACRKRKVGLVLLVAVLVLMAHAIHDGHNGKGNPFVWLFGRISFSGILYFHPYYQVTSRWRSRSAVH